MVLRTRVQIPDRVLRFGTTGEHRRTRRLEFYCGSVFLTAVVPSEPGSTDELAEIYTVVLIELLKFFERRSNHQRMEILEGVKKQPKLSFPPTGPGLLADSASTIGQLGKSAPKATNE